MGVAAGLAGGHDLVVHVEVGAGEEGAAVDDHVDLVGPGVDRGPHVGQLHVERRPARREGGGHGRHVHAETAERLDRHRLDQVAVDADGGHGRARRVGGSGRRPLAHSARTLPGVSCPSRVVRSTMRMARSRANALAVVLIDRVASPAARASTPDLVDARSPWRNRRSEASEAVTSARSPAVGAVAVTGSGYCQVAGRSGRRAWRVTAAGDRTTGMTGHVPGRRARQDDGRVDPPGRSLRPSRPWRAMELTWEQVLGWRVRRTGWPTPPATRSR